MGSRRGIRARALNCATLSVRMTSSINAMIYDGKAPLGGPAPAHQPVENPGTRTGTGEEDRQAASRTATFLACHRRQAPPVAIVPPRPGGDAPPLSHLLHRPPAARAAGSLPGMDRDGDMVGRQPRIEHPYSVTKRARASWASWRAQDGRYGPPPLVTFALEREP